MGKQTNREQKEYFTVNEEGTEKLVLAAVDAGVKRFVFISTIKVNGKNTRAALTENDEPNPKDVYSISKYNAEKLFKDSEKHRYRAYYFESSISLWP